MLVDGKSRRLAERKPSNLKVHIYCCESEDQSWEETSTLKDLSTSGARLLVKHPLEFGQLLLLTLPLPRHLRAFDKAERDYRVWVVVRSVKMMAISQPGKPLHEVGVAFIGKTPPPSFIRDPGTRYDLKPTPTRSGLWDVREMPRK
jgi:hypothetical protein